MGKRECAMLARLRPSTFENTRFLIMSLGFKGCQSGSAADRAAGGQGSLVSMSERLKLGKALGAWVSSVPNARRRIFLLLGADIRAGAGAGGSGKTFAAAVERWAGSLRPELLLHGVRSLLPLQPEEESLRQERHDCEEHDEH